MGIPDNYSMWARHEEEKERWLESRPICRCCGEHIQDEPVIHPDTGEEFCPECWEELMEEDEE